MTETEYLELVNAQPVGTYYISYINVQIKQPDGSWYTPETGQAVSATSIAGAMYYINSHNPRDLEGAWLF